MGQCGVGPMNFDDSGEGVLGWRGGFEKASSHQLIDQLVHILAKLIFGHLVLPEQGLDDCADRVPFSEELPDPCTDRVEGEIHPPAQVENDRLIANLARHDLRRYCQLAGGVHAQLVARA
jgi:hypothetical protein